MTGNKYQDLAMRTNDGKSTQRLNDWSISTKLHGYEGLQVEPGGLINGCLGLSGEAGEFNDIVKKWIFHGTLPDVEHMKKEVGDVCWYIAMICQSIGVNLDEIMQQNIDKLKARYPEGFDIEHANNRKEGDI